MNEKELGFEIAYAVGLRIDGKLTGDALEARIRRLVEENAEAFKELRENYNGTSDTTLDT
jgi:hypothetical protein